jgi:hypothetical protein
LSSGGLDDCGFPNSGSIEVDISTLFCGFGCRVEVEEFDNIANEVW